MKRLVPRKLYGIQGNSNEAQFTLFKADLFSNGVAVAVDHNGDVTTAITVSGATTTGILVSGAATTGFSITGAATTGISMTGTYTNGIDLTGATLTQATDNALFSIGSQAGAKTVALTASYLPLQVNLLSVSNPTGEVSMIGAYFKVASTTAAQADLQLVGAATRVSISKNIYDAYASQNHVSITDDMATAENYYNITGVSGKVTITSGKTVSKGQVTAGLFILDGAGEVTQRYYGVLIAIESAVTAVDAILKLETGATVTDCIEINGITNATNFVKFNAAAGPVSTTDVDPEAAPSAGGLGASGSIKIDVGGTSYFIPIFDTLVT